MSKVFLVAHGEYSDYGIVAVFSDIELAKDYCRSMNGSYELDGVDNGEYNIEEWEMDKKVPSIPVGKAVYRVNMTMSGSYSDVRINHNYSDYLECYRNWVDFRKAVDKNERWYSDCSDIQKEHHMCTFVLARDEKHAVKIANERRVFLIANNIFHTKNFSKTNYYAIDDALRNFHEELEDEIFEYSEY